MGNFSESDLEKMGLQKNLDGSWQKPKTQPQPRELLKNTQTTMRESYPISGRPMFRTVKLTLFGEPMPKQSVRSFIAGGKIMHYQPKEMEERTKDYQEQIRKQLPKDFTPFETCVFVRQMHFVFSPLKSFHKEKGKMEAIRNGKKYYKNTRPDLPDNLKKLVNDAMSGLVFTDDGIIVGEDDVKKYYGVGGCIIIELQGY